MKRNLTSDERWVVLQFAKALQEEPRKRLIADIKCAEVEALGSDDARIVFHLDGYERTTYQGQHPFGPEGRAEDKDGSELTVLLYADENGRVYELEIIRWDEKHIIAPNWSTLTVFP